MTPATAMWRAGLAVAGVLAVLGLDGCGVGYEVKPARLNVLAADRDSFAQLAQQAAGFLGTEGFDDLGKYTEMIKLIEHADLPPQDKKRQLDLLNRERTFLNNGRHLRVVLVDYTDGHRRASSLRYTPLAERFTEIQIYDERPGGFGSYGLGFYDRFLSSLRNSFPASVVVVERPPPTNERLYWSITIKNAIATTFGWFLAFAVPFSVTGPLSYYVLNHMTASRAVKRLTFTLVNTWLATPLPFPAAFILVIPLPNLLAFPWTDADYYSRVASFASVSFPCALLLCGAASTGLFRARAPSPC